MKKQLLTLALIIGASSAINAQEKQTEEEALDSIKYVRSSLTMVLIENDDLGKDKDLVINSYLSNAFPDKYNEHKISDKVFDPKKMTLETKDYLNAGFYVDTLKSPKDFLMANRKPFNPIRYVVADSSRAVQEPSKEEITNIYIQKYIIEKKLANQIASTWFNRKPDGSVDLELVNKLTQLSLQEKEKDEAKTGSLGKDLPIDSATIKAIRNTYTVFNRLNFFANEPAARIVRDLAKEEAVKNIKIPAALEKVNKGLDAVYEKTKEGYTVVCNSYLYQFVYNKDIADKSNKYFFGNAVDRLKAWDTTNLFKMNFVGKTKTVSIVTFKIGEKRTEAEIIELQVKRTMDKALAKLQKEYVQFRTLSKVSSGDPVTSAIGLKEGLEHGQTFEVLSREKNIWKSIGKVTVDKKHPIWDNTQGAEAEVDENEASKPVNQYSTFKGGKDVKKQHFIRLIK